MPAVITSPFKSLNSYPWIPTLGFLPWDSKGFIMILILELLRIRIHEQTSCSYRIHILHQSLHSPVYSVRPLRRLLSQVLYPNPT